MQIVELTDQEAALFKKFRQYQDNFEFLVKKGAFDLKGGSFTVHCNHQGVFMQIDLMSSSKREREKINIVNL